jgi:argininosuccinate synthase
MFYGQAIKHGVEQQTCVELRKKIIRLYLITFFGVRNSQTNLYTIKTRLSKQLMKKKTISILTRTISVF